MDEEEITFPANTLLSQDTGFQGFEPDGVCMMMPKKKPRKKRLTPEDKQWNTLISSCRIRVEHRHCTGENLTNFKGENQA